MNANYSDGVGQLGTGFPDTRPILSAGAIVPNVPNGLRMLGPDVEQIPGNASRRVLFDLPGCRS